MKRLSLIFTTLLLIFALSACKAEGGEPANNSPENEETKYSVTFVDENGATLKTESLLEGSVPSFSYNVTDTAEWDYTFKGWSDTPGGSVFSTLPALTKNSTYYAVVSKEKQVYTVEFITNGGSDVTLQNVIYGQTATEPEEPTREGFRFLGWCSDAELTKDVDWNTPIVANTKHYAAWNEKVDIKGLLSTLLDNYQSTPYDFIPEALHPSYTPNALFESALVTDYSSAVKISDINSHGYGEQWNMVISNINQSLVFHKVLSVVELLSATSISAFNNYLDTNTQDTASHSFKDGIYKISIDFDGEKISYVLEYTDTIPVFGEETVQIAMSMDVESGDRSVRMQIGDANALAYTVSEDSYEFAIKYLGIRRAYISIKLNDDTVEGSIYEFLTVSGVEIGSAAEFHITDTYASVVGNKASGMAGFTGYICEVYNSITGKLIGYEVEETLSAITYNTLWFDLDTFSGFNTIRYRESGDTKEFFINGSSKAWESEKFGGFDLKSLSRRYDIEFRKQYFYVYNASTGEHVETEVLVPMIFIQEEKYGSFISDVKSTNNIQLTMTLSNSEFNTITEGYDTLIPVFKTHKDSISSEDIVNWIGNKVTIE